MKNLQRRKFLAYATLIMGGALSFKPIELVSQSSNQFPENKNKFGNNNKLLLEISNIPNFCTHEHWGSIDSIGKAPEQNGFRCDTTAGAQALRATSIWDIVIDPYAYGWMVVANRDPQVAATKAGMRTFIQWWEESPKKAFHEFKSLCSSFQITGGFQTTRRGIQYLYGFDIGDFHLQDWINLDEQVNSNYDDIFSWHKTAMSKANFSEIIRPVHPEFYIQKETKASKAKELEFTHTVMRIDPLFDLWKETNPRREALVKILGVDPVNAQTWREFIGRIFDLASSNGAIGIKSLQAYRRNLFFEKRSDSKIVFRGNLDKEKALYLQDWVMHECCRQSNERNWVHQIHVGTNNIEESTPLPLQSLSNAYPNMRTVMIHCWPFIKEAGYLAKICPNIFIDTCWLPVLNPDFLREGLRQWLNYVPSHKIMLGHDSTHVEMAVGSALFTREILSESLSLQKEYLKVSDKTLKKLAADLLQNNAVKLYGIGKEYII